MNTNICIKPHFHVFFASNYYIPVLCIPYINQLDNAIFDFFQIVSKFALALPNPIVLKNRIDPDTKTLEQLQKAMEEYIEYYNNERIQVKLKGLTPCQAKNQSLYSF